MRKLSLILFAAIAGCAALPVCAEESAPATAPPAASAPAPVPDSKPASSVAPAPATERESAPVSAAEQKTLAAAHDGSKPFKPPQDFRPRKKGGQTLYCKSETVLGSRFPKELCMTEDQLRQYALDAAAMRRELGQHQAMCTGAAGCGSN